MTCCAQWAASEGRYLLPSLHSLPQHTGYPNTIHSIPVAPCLENWPREWLIFSVSWRQYSPSHSRHSTEDQQNLQVPLLRRPELQPTPPDHGEQSWGAHQLLAPRHVCEKFSEHTFLLQQILSKSTLRMKISKGEMPEWETKLVTPKMASANGSLWVERGDFTTCSP